MNKAMMEFDDAVWESVLPRVKKQGPRAYHSALFYSPDMDRYLDADDPTPRSRQTVRQSLIRMGVTSFVRLPQSVGLTNYLQIDYDSCVNGGRR